MFWGLCCVYPKSRNFSFLVPCSATEEVCKKKTKNKTKKVWGSMAGTGGLNWPTGKSPAQSTMAFTQIGDVTWKRSQSGLGKWSLAAVNSQWVIALWLTHLLGFFSIIIIIVTSIRTIIIIFYFSFNYKTGFISTLKFYFTSPPTSTGVGGGEGELSEHLWGVSSPAGFKTMTGTYHHSQEMMIGSPSHTIHYCYWHMTVRLHQFRHLIYPP